MSHFSAAGVTGDIAPESAEHVFYQGCLRYLNSRRMISDGAPVLWEVSKAGHRGQLFAPADHEV